jgi:uncharacterized protein YegL
MGNSASIIPVEVNNMNVSLVHSGNNLSTDDLMTENPTLVVIALDSSQSLENYENEVIDAFNKTIDAWKDSKSVGEIIIELITFSSNVKVVHNFRPIDQVDKLNGSNYSCGGTTSLYDATIKGLKDLADYADDLLSQGYRPNCIFIVFTDGHDVGSRIANSAMVKDIATKLNHSESFTLALAAVGDDAPGIAADMGFPNVITKGLDAHAIREIFNFISNSTVRVSKSNVSTKSGFFQ